MLRRDRGNLSSLRPRQVAPPLLVVSLVGLAPFAPFSATARRLLAVEVAGYVAVLLAAGVQSARRARDVRLTVGVPLAIATLHVTWGIGFLEVLLRERTRRD
jgi:hypothetical protein